MKGNRQSMLLRLHMEQPDTTKKLIFFLPQVSLQDRIQEISFNLIYLQMHLGIACICRGGFISPFPRFTDFAHKCLVFGGREVEQT